MQSAAVSDFAKDCSLYRIPICKLIDNNLIFTVYDHVHLMMFYSPLSFTISRQSHRCQCCLQE